VPPTENQAAQSCGLERPNKNRFTCVLNVTPIRVEVQGISLSLCARPYFKGRLCPALIATGLESLPIRLATSRFLAHQVMG